MKVGYRKPSVSKKFKAKTTGRIKRATKSSINPLYGKSGMGYINDPKKAVYNKVYNKTTKSVYDMFDEDLNTDFDYSDDLDYNDDLDYKYSFDYDDYYDSLDDFDYSDKIDSDDNLIDKSIYVSNNQINNKNKDNTLFQALLALLIILAVILLFLVITITYFGLW